MGQFRLPSSVILSPDWNDRKISTQSHKLRFNYLKQWPTFHLAMLLPVSIYGFDKSFLPRHFFSFFTKKSLYKFMSCLTRTKTVFSSEFGLIESHQLSIKSNRHYSNSVALDALNWISFNNLEWFDCRHKLNWSNVIALIQLVDDNQQVTN